MKFLNVEKKNYWSGKSKKKPMSFHLRKLDEDSLYEHVFDRYVKLENNVELLKQDLGIQDRSQTQLEVNIEPGHKQDIPNVTEHSSNKIRGRRKKTKKDDRDVYNLTIDQSLTSLNSTRDNNNSTTGYVMWSITPFFINWLLYSIEAGPLRHGGTVSIFDSDNTDAFVPAMINNSETGKNGIIELGSGICGILPVVLCNYLDHYVVTDQKGIIPKLKLNIESNLSQISKRALNCSQLNLVHEQTEHNADEKNPSRTKRACQLDIVGLDWEKFSLNDTTLQRLYPFLQTLQTNDAIYIVAMDVIYNEYLIDSFLSTVSQLYQHYRIQDVAVHFLMGLQLRSQDVVTRFLEKAVIELTLPLCVVESTVWQDSRYALYYF